MCSCLDSEKNQVRDDLRSGNVHGLTNFIKNRLVIFFAYLVSSEYFRVVASLPGTVLDIFMDYDSQNFKKFTQTLGIFRGEFESTIIALSAVDLLIEKGWFEYFLELSPDDQFRFVGYPIHFYASTISDTIVISHEDHEGGVHKLQIPRDEFRSFIRSVNRG